MSDPLITRVACTIDGRRTVLEGHSIARLLDALRQAGLTGVKEGCGEGECGACAILLDGELVNSCLTPLSHAEGRTIMTVEGIPGDDLLQAIQTSFVECGGAQCGICTPGMVLAAYELLSRTQDPSEDDVRAALAGNLCRCTGYQRIFAAVLDAAQKSPRIARP
ncbi:MAG TPA: (2Fe-2S)-binding protein [Vicinamibacterales bacterium]